MHKTIISIIIPVYNDLKIKRALNSLRRCINKTTTEVIVIDGGSNSDILDIIENNRDIIDIIVSEKDKGPYDAANKGILMSKGEWIFWFAADDEMLMNPGDLLKKYDVTNVDIICGSILSENRYGKYKIISSDPDLRKLDYHCTLRQPATLFRKETILRVGLYDLQYQYAADRELFLRLREQKARFIIVDEVIVQFHYGGLTTSKKVIDAYKEDYIISIRYNVNTIISLLFMWIRIIQFSFYRLWKPSKKEQI